MIAFIAYANITSVSAGLETDRHCQLETLDSLPVRQLSFCTSTASGDFHDLYFSVLQPRARYSHLNSYYSPRVLSLWLRFGHSSN